MALQDHVIKGSSDFTKGSYSLNITTLLDLVALSVAVVGKIILIYHVASRDHVFKRFCNFVDGNFTK